jgi:hypothetical protein
MQKNLTRPSLVAIASGNGFYAHDILQVFVIVKVLDNHHLKLTLLYN